MGPWLFTHSKWSFPLCKAGDSTWFSDLACVIASFSHCLLQVCQFFSSFGLPGFFCLLVLTAFRIKSHFLECPLIPVCLHLLFSCIWWTLSLCVRAAEQTVCPVQGDGVHLLLSVWVMGIAVSLRLWFCLHTSWENQNLIGHLCWLNV